MSQSLEARIAEWELLARLTEVAAATGHERLAQEYRNRENRIGIKKGEIELADMAIAAIRVNIPAHKRK